jgi:serine/threonine protein kinase
VYKAVYLGAPAAVVCVSRRSHPFLEDWPSHVASFWREAEQQCRFRDDHLVFVHGAAEFLNYAGEVEELALVMKFAGRGTLAAWLAGEGRVAARASRLALLLDVARGLRYLHAPGRDFVHGDVKPQNVIMLDGGRAQLADFDLSRVRSAVDAPRGTPCYMAPEMAPENWQSSGSLKPACDVYSLGVLMWEMLTGEDAVAAIVGGGGGGDPVTELYRRVDGGARPDAARVGDPALAALLTRMWAADPAARPTAAVLCDELERALAQQPPPAAQVAGALHQAAQVMAGGAHAPLTTPPPPNGGGGGNGGGQPPPPPPPPPPNDGGGGNGGGQPPPPPPPPPFVLLTESAAGSQQKWTCPACGVDNSDALVCQNCKAPRPSRAFEEGGTPIEEGGTPPSGWTFLPQSWNILPARTPAPLGVLPERPPTPPTRKSP